MAYDSYTKFICHFDGDDEAVSAIDESQNAHGITFVGDAQIDTAQKKFGTASVLFDGTGDFLTIPDSSDWNLGTGDFTIDFWVRFHTLGVNEQFFIAQGTNSSNFWGLTWNPGYTPDRLRFIHLVGGDYAPNGLSAGCDWVPVVDTWYHVAVVRDGVTDADWYIFIDGVSKTLAYSEGTWATNLGDYSGTLHLASHITETDSSLLNGWLEEFRISKGVARWTENFTAPTEAYSGDPVIAPIQAGRSGHHIGGD